MLLRESISTQASITEESEKTFASPHVVRLQSRRGAEADIYPPRLDFLLKGGVQDSGVAIEILDDVRFGPTMRSVDAVNHDRA